MEPSMQPPRRVITGLDPQGRSCILFDDTSETVIWSTAENPADNSRSSDAGGGPFAFPTEGTLFIYCDFKPGSGSHVHATDTIDYIVVVSGEVTFITETGEVILRAGDVIVDRGHVHSWRNHTDATCRIMNVLCAARPVGEGATLSGVIEGVNQATAAR
jgi:quercetin dioxygenase-like cupin family protein